MYFILFSTTFSVTQKVLVEDDRQKICLYVNICLYLKKNINFKKIIAEHTGENIKSLTNIIYEKVDHIYAKATEINCVNHDA